MYFVKRFVAAIIDGVVTSLGVIPGWILMVVASALGEGGKVLAPLGALVAVGGYGAAWYFLVVQRTVRTGQSWGKTAMGLRVVPADGSPLTATTVFFREVVKFLVGGVCFLPLVVFFTADQQAIHDLVLKTYVREV